MVYVAQPNWQECVKPISASNSAANGSGDSSGTERWATQCGKTGDNGNAAAACGMPQVACTEAVYYKYPLKQPTFVTAQRSAWQSCDYVNLSMSLTLALAPRRYQLPPHRPSPSALRSPTKASNLIRLHSFIATGKRMLWTNRTLTRAYSGLPSNGVRQRVIKVSSSDNFPTLENDIHNLFLWRTTDGWTGYLTVGLKVNINQ